MRAATFLDGKFAIENVPSPSPGSGQVLVRPLVCGICGSDLHTRHHAHHLADMLDRAGFRGFMNPSEPVVLGHEFCCEIVDYGADCKREIPVGQRVVGLPFIAGPQGVELIGYSNHFNGAFAEEMLLQEDALFAVPDNVSTDVAALAEPLSVAVRAVANAAPTRDSAFAIYGCGPVGLFVIARLRHLGFGPILAIDPDPQRRAFAERLGADIVIAPAADEIARWWEGNGAPLGISDATAARGTGIIGKRPVIFECVGKPGILKTIAEQAPVGALVVVVGVCMEIDQVEPGFMVQKELQLRFTFAYNQNEFAEATQMIAKNPDWLAPLVTGHVTLDNVEDAFDMLERGGAQAKVLIRPS